MGRQPLGRVLGIELLTVDARGETLQGYRPTSDPAEEGSADIAKIVRQVELGDPCLLYTSRCV